MPYIKTIWEDYSADKDGTKINAEKLNKIENAIEAIVASIEASGGNTAKVLKELLEEGK